MSPLNRLHKHFSRAVVVEAMEGWHSGDLSRRSMRSQLAVVFAFLIVAGPVAMLIIAAWMALAFFGNVFTMILAALLAIGGLVLLPRLQRPPERLLTRQQAPEAFALLDQISAHLGAPQIDGIELMAGANAYLGQYGVIRRRVVLGIGIVLWDGLSDQERLALLAHEIAHLANDDPARGRILAWAIEVLIGWYEVFDAEEHQRLNLATDVLFGLLGALVWAMLRGLGWLYNLDSQKAEFLADGLSARVAGRRASVDLLHVLVRMSALNKVMATYMPRQHKDHDGPGIFEYIQEELAQMPAEEVARLEERMAAEELSVDASHPPTIYRLGFLSEISLEAPLMTVQPEPFAAMTEEFAIERARLGRALYGDYLDANT